MLSAASWAARERAQAWLDEVWERSPHVPDRSTKTLKRAARVVIDLALQARLELGQVSMHIARDRLKPDELDPSRAPPASLEEILEDRLGKRVSGKTAHKAVRLLERLGFGEVFFVHPAGEKRSRKPTTAFSSKKPKSPWYRPCLQLEVAGDLLAELLGERRVAEVVPAELMHRAAADARRERTTPIAAVLRNTGTIVPEQESRRPHFLPTEQRTRGAPPSSSGPPSTSEGASSSSSTPSDGDVARGAVQNSALEGVSSRLAEIFGASWREDAGETPLDLVARRRR